MSEHGARGAAAHGGSGRGSPQPARVRRRGAPASSTPSWRSTPTKAGALLPALWMVQEKHGWISPTGMAEVAEVLGLTAAYVKGVVTFYTMYHQHPVGRHFVQVCTTTPCNVCGAEKVGEAFLKATGAKRYGETSPDGQWTIVEVECLGACGFATPVMINDEFIESVTPESVPALVARYR